MAGPYGDPQGYSAAIMQHQKQQQLLQAAAQRKAAEAARQMAWQQEYERRMGEGFAGPATPPPDYTPVGEPGQYHTSQSPEAHTWGPMATGETEISPAGDLAIDLATGGGYAIARAGGRAAMGAGKEAFRQSLANTQRGMPRLGDPLATARTDAVMGRARHQGLEMTPLRRRVASVGTEAQPAPARAPQRGLETKRIGMMPQRAQPPTKRPGPFMRAKHEAEAARRGASESSERVAAQPMPRPAPGTRIKSTGPGVRRRTPAEGSTNTPGYANIPIKDRRVYEMQKRWAEQKPKEEAARRASDEKIEAFLKAKPTRGGEGRGAAWGEGKAQPREREYIDPYGFRDQRSYEGARIEAALEQNYADELYQKAIDHGLSDSQARMVSEDPDRYKGIMREILGY